MQERAAVMRNDASPLDLLTGASRLLVVVAHPDDESVSLGGALARRVQTRIAEGHLGPATRVVVVTDGAPRDPALRARTFGGDTPRARYADHRRAELVRALAHVRIGEADVDHLGLVDQEAALHLEPLARALARILAAHAPDVVVTHAYEGGHPDHDACAFAVRNAVRLAGAAGNPAPEAFLEMASYHAGRGELVTQRFLDHEEEHTLDLRPDEIRIKAAMMAEHASQAEVLADFSPAREALRVARTADFTRPPHEGPVRYERLGWLMTTARFAELAREATRGLARVSSRWSSVRRDELARRDRRSTVVLVPYSLGEVGTASSGGAEQILGALDEALVRAGHRSIVLGPSGSRVHGELVDTGTLPPVFDARVTEERRARLRETLAEVLACERVDVVHFHGLDYHAVLPPADDHHPPLLVTLHLDGSAYPKSALATTRRDLWLNPVSDTQARALPRCGNLLPPIPNGIAVTELAPSLEPGDYALVLGRVCWDKGIDAAIAACGRLELPLVIAGPVQPYPEHLAYFERSVVPHLGPRCRWVSAVSGHTKAELLGRARVLLVPSRAPETSSLVAMEAIASGTPVAALRAGALPEVVEDGVTGAIADDESTLHVAVRRALRLDRATCLRVGRSAFDVGTMAARYLALYERLAASGRVRPTLVFPADVARA